MSENAALLDAAEPAYALLYGSDKQLRAVHLESGKLLESVATGTDVIVLREDDKFRWVHFGSRAVQTAMDKTEPWRLVMPCYRHFCAWQFFLDQPERVLILGAGGGALARYLRRHFPQVYLCGVEQSGYMLQLSNRYFGLEQAVDALFQADALEFLNKPRANCYDLLHVDIFARDTMPDGLWQAGFYEGCAASLSASGVFVINTIVNNAPAFTALLTLVRNSFHQTLCLPVPGHDNIVILAFKSTPETALTELRYRAEQLSLSCDMDFQHVLDQLVAVNPKAHGRFIMD